MRRRYREYRQRRRRTTDRRPRSILKRPGVQIAILLIVALIIYLILQSGGGNNLPSQIGPEKVFNEYQNLAFVMTSAPLMKRINMA